MTTSNGCLGIFFSFFSNNSKKRKSSARKVYPYRLRDDFLSNAELSFYHVLRIALNGEDVICPKVSLAELFFIIDKKDQYKYFNKISRKRVDFVVCESQTMKPLFAVELDDRSHQRLDREVRDQFVHEVFDQAGVKLLRVPVRTTYSVTEVKHWLQAARSASLIHPSGSNSEFTAENIPLCPKCGLPMVKRTAKTGTNAGNSFYGCINYPRCKEILPLK